MTTPNLDATREKLEQKMQELNPAKQPLEVAGDAQRRRIPMTAPTRKLQVPKIPGFYCQWIRGTSARIEQALNAGFEFVKPEEVRLFNRTLGDDVLKSGNTDLGTRVSIVDGSDTGPDNQAIRMYLMKQKEEFHEEDMRLQQGRNDRIADALTAAYRTGMVGVGAEGAPNEMQSDLQARYVDRKRARVPDLFRRKK